LKHREFGRREWDEMRIVHYSLNEPINKESEVEWNERIEISFLHSFPTVFPFLVLCELLISLPLGAAMMNLRILYWRHFTLGFKFHYDERS
jgi:hypothetical protein